MILCTTRSKVILLFWRAICKILSNHIFEWSASNLAESIIKFIHLSCTVFAISFLSYSAKNTKKKTWQRDIWAKTTIASSIDPQHKPDTFEWINIDETDQKHRWCFKKWFYREYIALNVFIRFCGMFIITTVSIKSFCFSFHRFIFIHLFQILTYKSTCIVNDDKTI